MIRIYRSEEYPEVFRQLRFEDSDRVRGQYLIVGGVETYFVWTLDNDARNGHVHNADIAPTITTLPGLKPLNFDGEVMDAGLTKVRIAKRNRDREPR